MKAVLSTLGTIVFALLLLALLFVVTLVAGVGIVLVGRVLTLVGDLTTFQASLIALGAAVVIIGVLILVLRAEPARVPEWLDEDYDENYDDEDYEDADEDEEVKIVPPRSRNDPCPCGSGKKYKQCHGKVA